MNSNTLFRYQVPCPRSFREELDDPPGWSGDCFDAIDLSTPEEDGAVDVLMDEPN